MAPPRAIPVAIALPTIPSAYTTDGWPLMPDATNWNGKNLVELMRNGDSPFATIWDVNLLLNEVETALDGQVVDIPGVHTGANNYGFHLKLSDGRDVLARIANADVNMPGYEGPSQASRQRDLEFETDTYRLLLGTVAQIPSSRPLFSRHCHRYDDGPTGEIPKDISGRALMVFDMTRGQKSIWDELDDGQRHSLLAQAATIRAAMLNLELPSAFISRWIMWRAFQPAGAALVPSQLLPAPIGGSRDFCISMFTARVEALIKNEGHVVVVVGREGEDQDPDRHQDHALVSSPRALRLAAAKHSILRFLPHMLPPEEGGGDGAEGRGFYRLVLQHDDYGIHNMSILVDDGQQVSITSVFDWESASIVPVILSEVDFLVHSRFLAANEGGQPTWRMRDSSEEPQPQWHAENQKYATHYLKNIMAHAPYLEDMMETGKDARHLWLALKRWNGQDPEGFFGELGAWAEARMRWKDEGGPK